MSQVIDQLTKPIAISEQETINAKIKEKQAQFHYLLTEEAAARIISQEGGTLTNEQTVFTPLVNLSQGMRVTNVFRIIQFREPHKFKKENREGLLASISIRHGEIEGNLLLWNTDAKKLLSSDLTVNDCVLVRDAVVKTLTPLEFNADLLTTVQKSENTDNANNEIPQRSLRFVELKTLVPSEELVSIKTTLTNVGQVKQFESNGKKGKLCRATIRQDITTIPLVCWGEYAELIADNKENKEMLLVDVKARQNKLSNAVEIHTTNSTRITFGKEIERDEVTIKQIGELKDGDNATIHGSVEELKEIKTVRLCDKCFASIKGETCQCGGKAQHTIIAEAIIADSSGKISCSFFDSRALQLLEMKSIAHDIAPIVKQLKNESLKGKQMKLAVNIKFNGFLNQLTANCKEIIKAGELL